MKIIVEANMPFGREAFETIGKVRVVNGRTLTNDDLKDVDVMAIRSTTKVTPELLEGTPVKYVGTATIGAVVGAGGLGVVIIAGLVRNNLSFVVQGALAAAYLAFFADWFFSILEGMCFSPRELSRRAAA
ncbi:MAG: hypothetical protein ACOCW6_04695 [Spirochaetota bacterium]